MEKPKQKPIHILIAEDDPDDRLLVQDAFRESHLTVDLLFVEDGEDLMDYLRRRAMYGGPAPRPSLILLDLNMPRKDGREALQEIKADPQIRHIPVVVLTTSTAEEDILRSYDIGAAGYIAKPPSFEGLVDVVRSLGRYWFQIVELPS